jgi:hypothetical protein
MKLEDQVCSLDLAERLKELGVKQESTLYSCTDLGELTYSRDCSEAADATCGNHLSRFTVAELGEMLPDNVQLPRRSAGKWTQFALSIIADTEADARAKMLVYLIQNKLIAAPVGAERTNTNS